MKLKHFIFGIIIIIIDQLTKFLMINQNIIVIPNLLKFSYTENTGGAFGIGENAIILFASIILIIGIIFFIIKQNKAITNYIPITLILFGSIANLIDRIFRGYVIDFIDVNIFNFPNFNIADICIVLGIVALIINIFIHCKSK